MIGKTFKRISIILAGVLIYILIAVWLRTDIVSAAGGHTGLQTVLMPFLWIYYIAGAVLLLTLLLYPLSSMYIERKLYSAGLSNAAGAAPRLRKRSKDRTNPRTRIWEFSNPGIPLEIWMKKQAAMEAALGLTIVSIKYGQNKNRIILQIVPSQAVLPEFIEWDDKYLSPDSFVLTLGESYAGPVSVDLGKIPHILLGGSTGSGKSILLKLLLMQAAKKGADVYIADFKGGVDFPPAWHKLCRIILNEEELLRLLTALVNELERRKKLLKDAGCANIDGYNKNAREQLRRCIFACDEVAEVLDRTGASKERKELLAEIEARLAIIARQGRAFGIHLILATQRPDAGLISGQIRNNLDCRICGRADNILSQIILDSTAAADEIPKDARGRFLLYDSTVFQAYWFDESNLERR